MYKFGLYTDIQEAKNTHMEHIEDLIFNEGVNGTRKAINFLRDLRNMLAGHTSKPINVTVKWDGSPAVFAGVDPGDGQFFVAKKGLFNKTPEMYKTQDDVDKFLSGDLHKKFSIALKEFSKLGIKKGVFQGDLMFTKPDVSVKTIDGAKYYTFQPNTIVYAVPVNSALGQRIVKARIGVVWHTTYTGSEISKMSASFGKGIVNKMTSAPTVWMDDATYKDVSGNATFTEQETKQITALLSSTGKLFNQINAQYVNGLSKDEELLIRIKAYNNLKVRAGEKISNPSAHVNGLLNYIHGWYQKQIDSKKTEKSKKQWALKRKNAMKYLSNKQQLVRIYMLMNYIIDAKQIIINKLNNAGHMGTFVRTVNGYKVTTVEGFVAIDHVGEAVKLVDRMEFSRNNFSPEILKGWQK